jgi:hypothetical protein
MVMVSLPGRGVCPAPFPNRTMLDGFMSMRLTYIRSELRMLRSKGLLISSFKTLPQGSRVQENGRSDAQGEEPSKALGTILFE